MISTVDVETATPDATRPIPLVVDLDGTLIKSDLLIEAVFAHLAQDLTGAVGIARSMLGGKAALKSMLASKREIDASLLPYDDEVLALIAGAKADGRPVYLATASHEIKAAAVAKHLGLFDGVFATSSDHNLSGKNKARVLVEAFGSKGFDYVGNDAPDLHVWKEAREAHAIRLAPGHRRRLERMGGPVHIVPTAATSRLKVWLKALRVHQYAKNTLIFLPLLAGHAFDLHQILAALVAFVTFSAAASAVYLLNDLMDLEADRRHPTKSRRPFASGTLSMTSGIAAMILLGLFALGVGALLSLKYLAVLVGYLVLTTAYSMFIKRKMLIDIVVLALLYTVRVVAGGVAVHVALSEWLLTFSLFIFTALALIKRYTELTVRLDAGLADATNRNYRKDDLVVIGALAAAAGMNAVTVFALYLASPAVTEVYSRPKFLWAICPLLIYLISRTLLMAHRRQMHDDPIVFALQDRICRLAIIAIGVLVVVAI